MCCVSIDGLFQRWIQFHLAVPRVGSLWGEGKGARTPPTGLRPSFFWEKFCSAVALLGCPQTHSSALGRPKCLWQGETIKCWREGEHPFPVLNLQDFSGGPVVKNPPANAGHTGSILAPGRFHMPPGKIPHASRQGRVAPARCNWRKSLCSNTDLAQPKIILFKSPAPSHSSQYVGGKGERMQFSSVLFV